MGRAVLFRGAGQPLDVVRTIALAPGLGEILVRITCCTLCRSDLHTHAGRRSEPTPVILGHEIVGRIEAFGSEAPRADARGAPATEGDRITWSVAVGCGRCFFCDDDLPQKCERLYKYGHVRANPEVPHGGGLADHIILVPNTTWYRLPDILTDRVAAPANCAIATAAAVLRHAGPLAGRSILVLGAGMLGVTACAMAAAAGARQILVSDRDAGCRQRALAFGATHVLSADRDSLTAEVRERTEGRGADAVLELAGAASTVEAGLALVRTGGILVLAGTVAPVGTVAFDPEAMVRRLATIRGVHNYHPRDLEAAIDFLAGPGQVFPFDALVGDQYSLDDIEKAFAHAHSHPGLRVAVIP